MMKGFWKKFGLAMLIIITCVALVFIIRFIYVPYTYRAQVSDVSFFENEEYLERERIAEAAEKIEDCERIEHELWRSYCYSHLAIKLDEPSLCDKITVESDTKMLFFSKDLCLINTAKKSEDCEKIKSEYRRSECYANLAEKLNNSLLCEKIEDETSRNFCKSSFTLSLDEILKSLDKILNKEIEYSGWLDYYEKKDVYYICGNCFQIGSPYELRKAPVPGARGPCCCCYWLRSEGIDSSRYKTLIRKTLTIQGIVRKTKSASQEGNCSISYGCDRLFFEVKEIIGNVT